MSVEQSIQDSTPQGEQPSSGSPGGNNDGGADRGAELERIGNSLLSALDGEEAPKGKGAEENNRKAEPKANQGQEAAPKAEPKPGAAGESKEQPQGAFAAIKYKADGAEHEIKSQDDLMRLLAAGHNFTQKTQQLKKEFADAVKPYRALDEQVKADPALGEILQKVTVNKRVRGPLLKALKSWEEKGLIHESEYRAGAYELNENLDKKARETEQAEASKDEKRQLLTEHLAAVSEELGRPVQQGDEHFKALVKLMNDRRLPDLVAANKLWMVESGEYEKRVQARLQSEQQANRAKLRNAGGVRKTGTTGPAPKSLEDIGATLLSGLED